MFLPIRFRLVEVERPRITLGPRVRIGAACVLTAVLAGWSALPVGATGTGVAGTISVFVPVKAITVSPGAVTFCSAGTPLTLPNGTCAFNGVTVTSTGNVTETINVNGSGAVPTDNGAGWLLCGYQLASFQSPFCTGASKAGSARLPAANQYLLCTSGAVLNTALTDCVPQTLLGTAVAGTTTLTNAPQCDSAFQAGLTGAIAGGCQAQVGQSSQENLLLTGPQSTTDQSGSFSTTITWTAS